MEISGGQNTKSSKGIVPKILYTQKTCFYSYFCDKELKGIEDFCE